MIKKSQKTFIITGGAGFIGSHLVDRVIQNGHRTIIIDDFSEGRKENIAHHKNNIVVYKRSIIDNIDDIFKKEKPDVVMHLAALARVQLSIENPKRTNDVNINGTLNLLTTAQKFGVKRFLNYCSSS